MIESGFPNSMYLNWCTDVETDPNQPLDGVNTTKIRDKRLCTEMKVLREMVEKDEIKLEWIKDD